MPKAKEVATQEQSAELEVVETDSIEQGSIVATVWPTSHKFTETEKSISALTKKYSHLSQLKVDDKDAYKELVLAIADMRTKRTGNKKEEDDAKGPVNTWLTMVRATGKKIRDLISTEEERLKKEKARIDDIIAENKLKQQRLWQDNLGTVTSVLQTVGSLDADQLTELLDKQNSYDFKALDFGDFLDQAKAAVAQNVNAIHGRINFLVEQKKLADEKIWNDNLNIVRNWATNVASETDKGLQQTICRLEAFDLNTMKFGDLLEEANSALNAALNRALTEDERRANARIEKKKQEEAAAEQAAEKQKRDDEKAESDRVAAEQEAENQNLRDQLAALQKPEKCIDDGIHDCTQDIESGYRPARGEITGANMAGWNNESVTTVESQGQVTIVEGSLVCENPEPIAGRATAIQQHPESTVNHGTLVVDLGSVETASKVEFRIWLNRIKDVRNSVPGDLTGKHDIAANQVCVNLDNIIKYLEGKV